MIEEYPPASHNPNKDTVKDVFETLNFHLAAKATQLALASIASLAGIITPNDSENQL
jgi:hypothetical protein